MKKHYYYMNKCIVLAETAKHCGDIPVGCLIVDKKTGHIVSKGYNMKYKKKDSTMHAEIIALKKAYKKEKSIYLENCVIYITLEPCLMCLGAIINSRIKHIIVGTLHNDYNKGYVFDYKKMGIKFENLSDLQCKTLLSDFFKEKRRK